jgi:hypothetical protein
MWVFPPSSVEFSSHHGFYKLSHSWLLGSITAPASCHVCLQLTWEEGLPPLLWSFSPSTTLTSFPAPGCWAHTPAPTKASPACPSLFIYSSGKDSLHPIFGAQCNPPSFPCVFIVLIAYYSVSLISLSGDRSVQGAMLIWPKVVCGSTAVLLSSSCLCFPKPSGSRWLVAWGHSWFLHLTWTGDALHDLEVGRESMFWLFSVVFPARCVSSVSPRFDYMRHAFFFLPLATILESLLRSFL